MDFPQCDITSCSVDWLIQFDRLSNNKFCNTSVLQTFIQEDNVKWKQFTWLSEVLLLDGFHWQLRHL